MKNTTMTAGKTATLSEGVTETQNNSRVQIIKQICHCGYCKFCNDSNGTVVFQVYLDNKPVCAGATEEEAKEEYEGLCERQYELEFARENPMFLGRDD